ncbi:unnamed protein product [Callosobruchus maculatus]|uniref:Fibronectin type III domain-containing protein n=1 Tax=Callosobruchus maculatus TaxID=64391 RepID=A0A653CQE3_CALMS|nr:unnamed protein product [Callosobruchus maculatus]
MEVEVREEATVAGRAPSRETTALLGNNTPYYPVTESPVVIVRVEEVLLVVLVLIIWAGAIALFFNRWGKIRMLEPYQPKFRGGTSSGSVAPSVGGPGMGAGTGHRPSCPLAPLSPPGGLGQVGACPRICPLRPRRIARQHAMERSSDEAIETAQSIVCGRS